MAVALAGGRGRLAMLLAACCWLAVTAPALSAEITSVTPPGVMQGDTIMLTITGRDLPTGTVVVEFFPQQIAVLKVLSATDREILVQIKVPNLASPGTYNIMIYNHLGEEAFGEEVLTVGSDLVTPIFEDYDPKQISSATDGFALMLTGSLVTQEAVQQLRMEWEQGGKRISGVTTAFALAGPETVVCAVSGRLRSGTLRGKVLMGDTPVYFVEVVIALEGVAIIGHAPSVLDVLQEQYLVRLLGSDFTRVMAGGMLVELSTESVTVRAQTVNFVDESTVSAEFQGPLPAGVYNLDALVDGKVAYSGELTLERGAGEDITTDIETELEAGGEPVADEPGAEGEPDAPDDHAPEVDEPEEMFEPAVQAMQITGVSLSSLAPGVNPQRMDVECTGISTDQFEELEPVLTIGGEAAELMLVSTGAGAFTWVFAPDASGWQSGETGELSIVDPASGAAMFSAALVVGAGVAPDEPEAAAAVEDGTATHEEDEPESDLRVISAAVEPGPEQMVLRVELGVPAGVDPTTLESDFSLLPLDPGLMEYFSNITLKGDLSFIATTPGRAMAVADGVFVSGDLLVKLRTADGESVLNSLQLAAPQVTARVAAPGTSGISVDPATGAIEPAWLTWRVDFGLLSPRQPDIIAVNTEPGLSEAEVLVVRNQGGNLNVEVELHTLGDALTAGDEFRVGFESPLQLDWSPGAQFTFPVAGPQKAQPALQLTAPASVDLTPEGFTIRLAVGTATDVAKIRERPVVTSDLLLLQWNLISFEQETVITDSTGGLVLELRFLRKTDKISDEAYGYFVEELVDSSPVGFMLGWPIEGLEHSFTVDFANALVRTGEE